MVGQLRLFLNKYVLLVILGTLTLKRGCPVMVTSVESLYSAQVVPLDDHRDHYRAPMIMPFFGEGGPRSWDDRGDGL